MLFVFFIQRRVLLIMDVTAAALAVVSVTPTARSHTCLAAANLSVILAAVAVVAPVATATVAYIYAFVINMCAHGVVASVVLCSVL